MEDMRSWKALNMNQSSERPTTHDDVFKEAAHQACKFARMKRALLWASAVFLLFFTIISPMLRREARTIGSLLLIVSLSALFVWTGVEFARQGNLYRKLRAVFATEPNETRQSVSPSVIGPLLEVALSESADSECLLVSMALLVDLLKSVQEDDQVVLTANQRHLLHKIVLYGGWDWENLMRAGTRIGETEYEVLRPPAIRAMGVLGNSDSVPILKRFARKTEDPELRVSVLHSIEQIRKRARYGPDQMLRPSDAPERPDTLLRALLSDLPRNEDPKQLLRPGTTDAER